MNILYLEDNPSDADLTCRSLKKAAPQFVVDVVNTLREARARLEIIPSPYDLALTDMCLMDGNGMDLLGDIRAQNLPIAVVVITGAGDEATVVVALHAGADDYIVKRGDYLERLPTTLRSALNHFRDDEARQSHSLRVLYAEHEPNNLELVRRHFARHAPQLRTEVVYTATQVLDRLPKHGPDCDYDLFLLDYRLPGMNGMELLKELRQTRSLDLPIVILTAEGDEEIAIQALKLGAADYLVKSADFLHRLPTALENAYFRAKLLRDQAALRASETRFRSLMEQSPFSIQIFSPQGRTLQVNPAWERLWAMQASQLSEYNILQDAQLRDKGIMPYIEQGFAGQATEIPPVIYNSAENPVAPGPSSKRWVRAYIYPLKDDVGAVREVVLMHEDISQKKYVEDTIRLIAAGVSSETGAQFFQQFVMQLGKIFSTDYVFVAVFDKQTPTTVSTLAVCAHGKLAANFTYSHDYTPCAKVIGNDFCIYPQDVRQYFPDDILLRDMQAESYIGTPLFDAVGNPLGLIVILDSKPMKETAMAVDILEIFAARAAAEMQRLHAEERIYRMAFHDYLTGLPNRARLLEYLSGVLEQAKRSQRHGAVLLIDLDHFKTINDALGHEVGDLVLRDVARQLEETVAGHAFAARMGGDEFVIVMPDIDLDEETAVVVSRQLAEEVATRLGKAIPVGDRMLNIGASIGIALFPGQAATVLDMLRCVDMALYRAKEQGRNNIRFFMPSMQADADERLWLERGLRQALVNDELMLHLQPQFDSAGGVSGAEVLLRWHHPETGLINPATFIPVAEESGLIHTIGEWVLDQACMWLMTCTDAGTSFNSRLSVNVSPWQLAHPDFVSQVRRIVAKHHVDPSRLMLEITESALLNDIKEVISKLTELRSMGIRISLDDFGTGYSSLSYLKDLPLDEIKIDQSFVKQLVPGENNSLINAIIAVGQHLGLAVIAEGVETEAQRDILQKLGCLNFQGNLFSQPMPAKAFLEWLDESAKLPWSSSE